MVSLDLRNFWKPVRRISAVVAVVAVLSIVFVLLTCHPREFHRRMACRANLLYIGNALDNYSVDYGGNYPWRIGAGNPREAWRDLGLLYPDYCPQLRLFLCPSSHEREVPVSSVAMQEESPFDPAVGRRTISYAYSYDMTSGAPSPWASTAQPSVCVLADRSAGRHISGKDAAQANHGKAGRNVLYIERWVEWDPENEAMHRRVEWVSGSAALDPDPTSDKIGPNGATDYTDWWSDPPYPEE